MLLYDVKFNMNAQTWLLNHYWLFLLEYFFPSQGGPWSKRLCRPYAYGYSIHKTFGLVTRYVNFSAYCRTYLGWHSHQMSWINNMFEYVANLFYVGYTHIHGHHCIVTSN